MNKHIKGSPRNEALRHEHKKMGNPFYGMDGDFMLIVKKPRPMILAFYDFKAENEPITFSEVIAYNHFLRLCIPVYVIEEIGHGDSSRCDNCGKVDRDAHYPMRIYRYNSGDWKPDPPTVDIKEVKIINNLNEWREWETGLRNYLIDSYQERMKWVVEYNESLLDGGKT